MGSTAARCALGALLLAGLGCEVDDALLTVDLRTDFALGTELDRVDLLTVEGPEAISLRMHPRGEGLEPLRVAELEGVEPGRYRFAVLAWRPDGSSLARTELIIDVRGTTPVRILLSRDCAGVRCPTSDPDLTACLGGQCVHPGCAGGDRADCRNPPECAATADCRSETLACGRFECVDDWCLVDRVDACETPLSCEPEVGCLGEGTPPWRVAGMSYRLALRVPAGAVDETLTDFPLAVVRHDDEALAAALQTDDAAIRFVWEPHGATLPHEVERLDADGGELVTWVRLPELRSDAATEIYLYAGATTQSEDPSPEATVWTPEFRNVLHLGDEPTATRGGFRNSVGRDHGTGGDGDPAQVPTRIPGVVGDGQRFDGIDDYIRLSYGSDREEGTVSHWFRSGPGQMVIYYESDGVRAGMDGFGHGVDALELNTGVLTDDAADFAGIIAAHQDGGEESQYWVNENVGTETWTHVAHTWRSDGATVLYIDGVEVDRQDMSGLTRQRRASGYVTLGRPADAESGRLLNGDVDELRVTGIARSAAWIAASYENQRDPASFYVAGVPESRF